jgi:hypothetical protein
MNMDLDKVALYAKDYYVYMMRDIYDKATFSFGQMSSYLLC